MKKIALSAIVVFGLAASLGAQAEVPTRLLGSVTTPTEASRTITITPATRSVNVTEGDVVRFVANGREFAFNFNGADDVSSFNLQRVAPAGVLDHAVTAYVASDPEGN